MTAPISTEQVGWSFPLGARVRPGGVIGGHDYLDGDFPPHGEFGVRSAVDGFFGRAGLTVHATLADRPWVSWFVPMPGQARWP